MLLEQKDRETRIATNIKEKKNIIAVFASVFKKNVTKNNPKNKTGCNKQEQSRPPDMLCDVAAAVPPTHRSL